MELTYTQCGDYLIPNLVLSDTREYHIGKYGRMRRVYLKDHRPALYSSGHTAPNENGTVQTDSSCHRPSLPIVNTMLFE